MPKRTNETKQYNFSIIELYTKRCMLLTRSASIRKTFQKLFYNFQKLFYNLHHSINDMSDNQQSYQDHPYAHNTIYNNIDCLLLFRFRHQEPYRNDISDRHRCSSDPNDNHHNPCEDRILLRKGQSTNKQQDNAKSRNEP